MSALLVVAATASWRLAHELLEAPGPDKQQRRGFDRLLPEDALVEGAGGAGWGLCQFPSLARQPSRAMMASSTLASYTSAIFLSFGKNLKACT